ncbi:hypothetical protein KEM55_001430, partial [Ascosphaera atra]
LVGQQNEIIQALLERLKHFEEFAVDPTREVAEKEKQAEYLHVIQRQAREIALISSAWYEQQSRLQNGSVPIPRLRHPTISSSAADIHKSWLAKQRAVVIGGAGERGSRPTS